MLSSNARLETVGSSGHLSINDEELSGEDREWGSSESFMLSKRRESQRLMRESVVANRLKWVSDSNFSYESLDFQDVENELLKEQRIKKAVGTSHPRTATRWLLLFLIGLLTGTTAFVIDEGITFITKKKWTWVGDQMKTDPTNPGQVPFTTPYLMFLSMNIALAAIACFFVVYVEPLAAGSGIPEVKCYLNGIKIYRVVRLRTLVAKATGILFSVASGLPCGKEGPMIHSGAIIGGGVATGKSSKFHFDTGLFKEYRGDSDKRLFVTAGAAAGVAAAFGAPVGGVLFAVEEVGSFWNLEMSVQVFFCAACSSLAINMYTKFKDPLSPASGQANFGQVNLPYKIWELPLCVVLGALGGLLGAFFNAANLRITKIRRKIVKGKPVRRMIEVCVINVLVSTVLFVLTSRLYNCEPVTQLAGNGTSSDSFSSFGCRTDNSTGIPQFNDMATFFFSQTEANIRHMFHGPSDFSYASLIMHFVPYYLLTILTYGIAVPSGLFLPCLALGSSIGRIYGQSIRDITGFDLSLGTYACFGAAAVLGGVIRMTVSLSVIMMEATGNATYVIPLMLITCTAKWVGDLFNHGIYDEHIMLSRVPLLEHNLGHSKEADRLACATAQDVMNEVDVAVIDVRPTVRDVLELLRDKPHHQAFIITQHGTRSEPLLGLILRRYLLILIRSRAWGASANSLEFSNFVKSAHEREILKVQKYALELSPHDMSQKLSLSRYMDSHPFTVRTTSPLPRVYRIFRDLGLRHLIVVNENFFPAGIIARKCLVYLKDCAEIDWDDAPAERTKFQIERHPSAQRLPTSLFLHSDGAYLNPSFDSVAALSDDSVL
eukprot:TRINITY_DN2951_c0_g1_i1.p1 TRINITY_DN2951_c0_g1~~TRINITY_DN2951_c0_g1_i1.p1  ORF type:complete len:830 (+),score=110.67 TRINITY_DN2951_c0_g1_i1:34-2523(+)